MIQWATPEEVAASMGLSRHAVYMMVARGEIPAEMTYKIGRRLRFDSAKIRQWQSERCVASRKSAK